MKCMGTLLRNDFDTQNVYGARVMRMRCCGTKWSVLYSVLMLRSMGKLRSTVSALPGFTRVPDSPGVSGSPGYQSCHDYQCYQSYHVRVITGVRVIRVFGCSQGFLGLSIF